MSAAWTFFTNHAHILFAISRDPNVRVRDLAVLVGITERAAQRIVSELVHDGYLVAERVGRRNHYRVVGDHPLRHPLEAHHDVAGLVSWLGATDPRA